MNTFNQNRFHLLVENFFNTNVILTPKVVNKLEPVLSTVKRTLSVNLGCSLTSLTNLNNSQLIRFTNDGFYIKFDIKSMSHKVWNFYVYFLAVTPLFKGKNVYVLLHETISHSNLIKCLFQIEIVEHVISEKNSIYKENFHNEFANLKRSVSANSGNLYFKNLSYHSYNKMESSN